MPLTVSVPLQVGGGTIDPSSVSLVVNKASGGTDIYPMTPVAGSANTFSKEIPCVTKSTLFVQYSLTENGATQTFSVPLGGITLIDPQGVVYDKSTFDAQTAAGKTDDDARAAAAISGATVRLQRFDSGSGDFVSVLSGDPGIAPNVNPEVTGPDGKYQWDVSAGKYRVLVTAPGYVPVTGPGVDIPPPVLDGHIAMTRQASSSGTASSAASESPPESAASAPEAAGSSSQQQTPPSPSGPRATAASTITRLLSGVVVVRAGKVTVGSVMCTRPNGSCRLPVTATIYSNGGARSSSQRRIELGRVRVIPKGGRGSPLRVPLSRRALRLLRDRGSLAATVRLRTAAGHISKSRVTIRAGKHR